MDCLKKSIHPYCNHISSVAETSFFRPKYYCLIKLAYIRLIPWKNKKTAHSWCKRHTLTFFSSMVMQLCMRSLFEQDVIKKLLVFVLNTVKLLQIPCHSLFIWIWFYDIKIANGKQYSTYYLPENYKYHSFIVIFNFEITVLKTQKSGSTVQVQKS